MEQSRNWEKTGKSWKISHERLGLNLLPEIHLRVSLQRLHLLRGTPHDWQ
jgi:hypothetical protein